jgi:hypothetical protein
MFSPSLFRVVALLSNIPQRAIGRPERTPQLLAPVMCEVFCKTGPGMIDEDALQVQELQDAIVCPICTSTEIEEGVCLQCFCYVN